MRLVMFFIKLRKPGDEAPDAAAGQKRASAFLWRINGGVFCVQAALIATGLLLLRPQYIGNPQ